MVFHCIFRHFGKPGIEKRLWNLSCDIAVEHMIDGIYHRSVRYSRSLLRRETYRLLEKEKKTLNAERIYKILKEEGPAHDRSFVAAVFNNGKELGRGLGKSKKVAEQKAAENAIKGQNHVS